ncbi:NADP-dependent oxidoreductase [Sphingomonas nostoxanthinifaciens]|uniref:NADP-dependent oxidoreductase n=1 Tax=Sphingomonas nostoxanthinifaciens TaxID=2872652 RepID=UPI001CC1C3DD|nr:NADP-dependent oxidoreductase [Sphingomonas nostoxanthinifaciens]UAK25962.1 NADP-dependent oxidoreductase [Sphingomonas nostoxanthinifaciens]
MKTSKAVRLSWFGGADALQIDPVAIPQPQDDEVLVRVVAASVNPVDYKIREGQFPPIREDMLPIILGRDLAGTIEAAGTSAHYMVVKGDPVFAHIGFDRGAQSEFVVVKAIELVAAPRSIDLVHAAAVPLAAMTAWQGLFDQGELQPGQTVLIHGGAGGVGHLAIQFAKAKGATVLTTVGTDDVDFVRAIGADTVIDYKTERFEDVAKDVDLVFDLVGGETQDRSFAVLRQGGTLVSTVGVADPDKGKARDIRVPERWMATPNAAQLGEIADLIDAGRVKVEVAETFPLDQVREAYARLEQGHVRGKIVLTFA